MYFSYTTPNIGFITIFYPFWSFPSISTTAESLFFFSIFFFFPPGKYQWLTYTFSGTISKIIMEKHVKTILKPTRLLGERDATITNCLGLSQRASYLEENAYLNATKTISERDFERSGQHFVMWQGNVQSH